MALKIKRNENVRGALRRIGRRLAGKAIKALRDCDTLEAVHEVRKEIKQMRALLRLVRGGVGRRSSRELTSRMKRTAEALAPSRDAYVKTSALEGLAAHFKHETPRPDFPGITRILSEDCRAKTKKLPQDLKQSRRLLKKVCGRFRSAAASRSGWKVIGQGIRKTYRDGRRAYQLARETSVPEDFHEWRKRAKDLLYQTGFLCGVWTEQMDALENELKKLSDYLGDGHDLSVLTGPETLEQLASHPKKEIETLKRLAGLRQQEFHEKALRLGGRLYHEKPDIFCKRLHQYWRRWRQKQTPARA